MIRAVRDFQDSTLWNISAFERVRRDTGTSGFSRLESNTQLPSTLRADLRRLHRDPTTDDVLEVVAACMRHREAALLCLQHEQLVWPVTLFPMQMLYHSPRDFALASPEGLATLGLITTEPPGVRPPGHWMHERVALAQQYRPLEPLLWSLALNGPRYTLLSEIGGRAAYRLMPNRTTGQKPSAPGALGAALQRLQRDSASLREMATWPGLSTERASRLLNALYLCSSLMVTRSHPAAREESGLVRGLLGIVPRLRR